MVVAVAGLAIGARVAEAAAPSEPLAAYLNGYFRNSDYRILKRHLDLGAVRLVIAVSDVNIKRYEDKPSTAPVKREVIGRGIGVEVSGAHVTPHIYFEKDRILDGKRRTVVDVSVHKYHYMGWVLWPSDHRPGVHAGGITLDYVFLRRGRISVGDSLSVHWNPKKRSFQASNTSQD